MKGTFSLCHEAINQIGAPCQPAVTHLLVEGDGFGVEVDLQTQ